MIDHRYSLRRQINAEVIINYNALGLIRGKVRDLGVGGMYVDLCCVQLPLNALVEVSILFDSGTLDKSARVMAMVVHQAGGGIGLMFWDLKQHCYDFFHQIVYSDSRVVVGNQDCRAIA